MYMRDGIEFRDSLYRKSPDKLKDSIESTYFAIIVFKDPATSRTAARNHLKRYMAVALFQTGFRFVPQMPFPRNRHPLNYLTIEKNSFKYFTTIFQFYLV